MPVPPETTTKSVVPSPMANSRPETATLMTSRSAPYVGATPSARFGLVTTFEVLFSNEKLALIAWPPRFISIPEPSMRRNGPAGRSRSTMLSPKINVSLTAPSIAATVSVASTVMRLLIDRPNVPVKEKPIPAFTETVAEIEAARPRSSMSSPPVPFDKTTVPSLGSSVESPSRSRRTPATATLSTVAPSTVDCSNVKRP